MQKNSFDIVPETEEDISYRNKLTKEYDKYLKSLNKKQRKFIKKKLSNIYWRLNNLYHIRDKDSRLTILRFNKAQEIVHSVKHNRVVILKSRQQGISTYYVARSMDKCIFQAGISAGIQSYGLDESNKLKMRAVLMFTEMDEDLKALLNISIIANNQKGILFSNGSILKIGNFRGDTIQLLHVSELAKIALMNPTRADEIKTGAFQAISTNSYISVESTAEMPSGMFFEMWNSAERKLKSGKNFSPLDFYPIFLSWVDDPDCSLDFELDVSDEAYEYADMLKKEYNITLTLPQLRWLTPKLDELGEDFNKEYPATPEMAFKQSVEGTYLLKQYKKLVKEHRIGKYKFMRDYPVYVSFDLGINDEMVMLFTQIVEGKTRLINEYHNTGEGFQHYINVLFMLKDKYGYNYSKIFMPHDMNVRELSSGLSRLQLARKMGLSNIVVLAKMKFKDSISAVRLFVDTLYIDESCKMTLDSIQLYRKKYDKAVGVYLDEDVHNIYSNYIASLRYMAQGLGYKKIAHSTRATASINERSRAKRTKNRRIYRKKKSSYTVV